MTFFEIDFSAPLRDALIGSHKFSEIALTFFGIRVPLEFMLAF